MNTRNVRIDREGEILNYPSDTPHVCARFVFFWHATDTAQNQYFCTTLPLDDVIEYTDIDLDDNYPTDTIAYLNDDDEWESETTYERKWEVDEYVVNRGMVQTGMIHDIDWMRLVVIL